MKRIGSIVGVLVAILAGCAISDEGEIDVRIVPINIAEKSNPELHELFYPKQKEDERPFEAGDLLSLHLIYGHVASFDEGALIPSELSYIAGRALAFRAPRVKGEIVIASRVFDFTGQGEGDFNNSSDSDAGRVVFYSDDVLKNQGLNFRNLPIYGPVEYTASPLALRLEARELDTNSKEEKALLTSLATLGSTAYAPLSPALSVLDEVGSTFIDAQPTSTRFFQMSMVLDAGEGGNQNHLQLRPGYLIFVKNRKRDGKFDWSTLTFCPSEGKLFKVNPDPSVRANEAKVTAMEAADVAEAAADRAVKAADTAEAAAERAAEARSRDTASPEGTSGTSKPLGTACTANGSPMELYRESTYFVIEIAKNVGSAEINIQQTGYEALITALRNNDTNRTPENFEAPPGIAETIRAERLLSSIREDILKAAGKTAEVSREERIVAGFEALTDLADQAQLVCREDTADATLSRTQLDYLFTLIRRSVPFTDTETRKLLLPFGNDGYCPQEPSTVSLSATEAAQSLRVDQIEGIFQINTK